MEPLSIAGGVIGLLGTTVKVASVLNDLYRDINTANLRISGLQETVQGFITLLNMMKDTLEREEIQASLGTTGHVNNHWAHVSVTIKDGQKTLLRLQKLLEKINKSKSLLDETRKNIRLQNEAQEIGVYKSQIQQYNDTLSLSLQTITVLVIPIHISRTLESDLIEYSDGINLLYSNLQTRLCQNWMDLNKKYDN
jgi:hypothetical protein